ncbi:uncharacterized protein Dwil_GK27878 [Drosophila willistoni]|uniref:Uncharacterized protein n=1 Tax=Drosophila willistoni TaxID=7260 RepID=A0A0Q9WZP8_DROWI|nr:uncharacterized protein Dwil_GK27878 [Drosophila willistoni]
MKKRNERREVYVKFGKRHAYNKPHTTPPSTPILSSPPVSTVHVTTNVCNIFHSSSQRDKTDPREARQSNCQQYIHTEILTYGRSGRTLRNY